MTPVVAAPVTPNLGEYPQSKNEKRRQNDMEYTVDDSDPHWIHRIAGGLHNCVHHHTKSNRRSPDDVSRADVSRPHNIRVMCYQPDDVLPDAGEGHQHGIGSGNYHRLLGYAICGLHVLSPDCPGNQGSHARREAHHYSLRELHNNAGHSHRSNRRIHEASLLRFMSMVGPSDMRVWVIVMGQESASRFLSILPWVQSLPIRRAGGALSRDT